MLSTLYNSVTILPAALQGSPTSQEGQRPREVRQEAQGHTASVQTAGLLWAVWPKLETMTVSGVCTHHSPVSHSQAIYCIPWHLC